MSVVRHDFTNRIIEILDGRFHAYGEKVLDNSELLQYLNIKTKAANRGSKSRAGFANHYAIYVLVEDYIKNHGFHKKDGYDEYDGGIDFVMKLLGRFFHVTETIDAGKYFLDIDKVQRYPITFVVKTEQNFDEVLERVKEQAIARYKVKGVVRQYMDSVEEVINIPELMKRLDEVLEQGKGREVIEEIVLQSCVEFNVEAEEQDVLAFDEAIQQSEAE